MEHPRKLPTKKFTSPRSNFQRKKSADKSYTKLQKLVFYYQTSRTELVRVEKQKRKREIKSVVGGVKGQTRPHYNSCNVGPPRERKRCRTCPAINADPHPHTPPDQPHQSDPQEHATGLWGHGVSRPTSHARRVGFGCVPGRNMGGIKMAMHWHVVVNPSLSR